jgi:uracil permease
MAGRSFLIVGGMTVATALFHARFTTTPPSSAGALWAPFFSSLTRPVFDAGTTLSVLFCFLALSLNEIGAMQAVAPLLRPSGMEGRIRRGMTVTGVVNGIAGLLGVIGPVDFSLSPGIIAAGGCGARLPLIPAGGLLLLLSFSPALLGTAALIPQTVVGAMLVYALSGQIAAGLTNAFSGGSFSMEDGLVIGGALLTGTTTAFLPAAVLSEFPAMLRTVAANGFVVGVVTVLLLDRLFYRKLN